MGQKEDFINLMLKSSKKTEETQPQSRTGNVDQKSAEELLKQIQEKLRKR